MASGSFLFNSTHFGDNLVIPQEESLIINRCCWKGVRAFKGTFAWEHSQLDHGCSVAELGLNTSLDVKLRLWSRFDRKSFWRGSNPSKLLIGDLSKFLIASTPPFPPRALENDMRECKWRLSGATMNYRCGLMFLWLKNKAAHLILLQYLPLPSSSLEV